MRSDTHDSVCKLLFCIAMMVLMFQIPTHRIPETPVAQSIPASTTNQTSLDSPGFHVLTVVATYHYHSTSYDWFAFKYNATLGRELRAHSGMVVILFRNCFGPNGTMRLVENGPHPIMTFTYHGQTLIPICGWRQTISFRGNITNETWGGAENLTTDWLRGTWNMTNGITMFRSQPTDILGTCEISVCYGIPTPAVPGWYYQPTNGGGGRKCR